MTTNIEQVISEEDFKKLRKINLAMALCFVNFCEKHGLLCYFCGGGCIGAIRHEGMIPWDDDLDFFMPRDDYEKAWRLWKKEQPHPDYILEKSDSEHIDGNLFFTIRNRQTTFIKPYAANFDITHGVTLDVLPLDGYPSGKLARRMQCFWALLYSLFCAQSIPTNHGRVVAGVARLALGLVPSKRVRYRLWRMAERKMTKYQISKCDYITELCSGPGYMKKKYPKEIFEKAIYRKFEQVEMPIPVGYDQYLKIAFGNYMELPPIDEQIPHHETLFMDLDTPCIQYKGVYYCKES